MVVVQSPALQDRLQLAISRLMAIRVDGERARLTVPVLYPSGSSGSVEIMTSGDKCFVSDMGLGHMEAEMYAAQEFYPHAARAASERFGVGFDGLTVFAA